MAGLAIGISINDKALRDRIMSIRNWKTAATKPIAIALVRGTQQRFRSAVSPDGEPWKPLNPAYAAIKRGPGILRSSQRLMKSITSNISSAGEIEIGTNVIYGRIHQLGGKIVPKDKKFLRFRLANATVFARSVTIPARPYLGISSDDMIAIRDVIDAVIIKQQTPRD